jgi:hypothetical protein
MTTHYTMAVAFSTALSCGCAATADDRRSGDTVKFTLNAGSRNAGEVGTAFMGARGDATWLRVEISGVPPWVSRPVQLYTFIFAGSCAGHDATPTFALNEIVQAGLFSNAARSGPFTLVKSVPVAMDALRSGTFALVVRASPADGNVDLYCGDMK